MAEHDLQTIAFPVLDESQLASLVRCSRGSIKRFQDGQKLFRAGDRDFKFFVVESWRVIVEQRADSDGESVTSEATVRLVAKGERVVAVGEGNGPVNALDRALRSALEQTFPELATLELTDFKVRILEGTSGTGAITRVLIESSDADGGTWSTVGVDENVISASWHALEEAVSYGLLRAGRTPD